MNGWVATLAAPLFLRLEWELPSVLQYSIRNQRRFYRWADGVNADDGSSVENGGHWGSETGRFPRFDGSEGNGLGGRIAPGMERRASATGCPILAAGHRGNSRQG
jgi:hypothetical protein